MDNKYGLKELQTTLLQMLIDIDRVCRENGICYSLYGGTLLGAIRHKGFIPWDDDVDLIFVRSEYEKFVKAYPKYGNKKYYLGKGVFYKCTPAVIFPEKTKLVQTNLDLPGPWISIFIFDTCPENFILAKLKVVLAKVLIGMMGKPIHYNRFGIKTKVFFTIASILGKLFPEKWKLSMHTNISKLGISLKSSYYSIYNTASKEINYMYPKNIISNYINVLFEGHEFMAMSGYHDYLKIDYGDYMTPPPIEKRLPKHH